jgi:hypothetical protein
LIAWNQIKDTVQLEIETQIKKESPWSKFFTERVELTMKAIVKAGIPGIADSRVVMNADKVEVTLPRAMILNVNPVTQEFGNIKKYPFYSNIESVAEFDGGRKGVGNRGWGAVGKLKSGVVDSFVL